MYCTKKGIMCTHTDEFGVCRMDVPCPVNGSNIVNGNNQAELIREYVFPDIMPDVLIINGIKYRKEN